MTDSTIDDKSGDGALEISPSADELFGEIEEPLDEEEIDRSAPDENPTGAIDADDRSASDVFAELRADAALEESDEDVLDESPDEIIDAADETAPDHAADDADLIDENALDDLLLSDRTEGEEFLWVDSGDSSAESDSTTEIDSDAKSDATDEASEDGDESDQSSERHTESASLDWVGQTIDTDASDTVTIRPIEENASGRDDRPDPESSTPPEQPPTSASIDETNDGDASTSTDAGASESTARAESAEPTEPVDDRTTDPGRTPLERTRDGADSTERGVTEATDATDAAGTDPDADDESVGGLPAATPNETGADRESRDAGDETVGGPPVPYDDDVERDDEPSGVVGWLRSLFGRLF